MRAAFFDLDRALLRSPVEAAARRFFRSARGEPPLLPAEELRLRLRRQVRALIAAHHWRGHVVVLLTEGSEEWAEMAAGELDADGVLRCPDRVERASRSLNPDRVAERLKAFRGPTADGARKPLKASATRSIDPIWRAGAVTRFCLRYNFAAGGCFGYGAQKGDWLWLETLGHPAVAHPLGSLRWRARESGWPILNLNGRSQLSAPPALGFGPAPPSAPPCVTLT